MASNKEQSPEEADGEAEEISPPLISSNQKGQKDEQKQRRLSAAMYGKKKSVVMTGDEVKQLQKQLRASREEKRLMLDTRHQFIFLKLADALGQESSAVEDQILSDERFNLVDDFFSVGGSRKLMFFYQDSVKEAGLSSISQKKLFITTGNTEELHGYCYFFLRTNAMKEITTSNIESEVNFMWMDCSDGKILESFENMMSKIIMPCLKSQKNWGKELDGNNAKVSDFLESIEDFMRNLAGIKGNMTSYITLEETEYGLMLDHMSPNDYQMSSMNNEIVEKLEQVLLSWIKQIEQVLTESEQIRREADDVGPSAELVYWRLRMTKFNSLLEQVKSTRCHAVIGVLNAAKSKSIRKWRELDSRITDAANEAKDNVKYLYTLDNFFGPLVKCNPASMLDLIPGLINAIRMIYSISTYYNSSERMTSLFGKVTNQMITTCKGYLTQGVQKIWDHPRTELLLRIKDCITLNEVYQLQFRKTKEKLSSTPSEKQFEFSENYIFGKFDTFTKRLEKIKDMISLIDTYSSIQDMRVDGIEIIAVRYKNITDAFKKKNYDVLDHRKQEFDMDYLDFRSQFDGLIGHMDIFINSWLDRNLSTEQSMELLGKFEHIRSEQLDLNRKYMKILNSYGRDLEEVRRIYQTKKKKVPTATLR